MNLTRGCTRGAMDLDRIPTILTAQELTDKAFRRASKTSGSGRDAVKRAQGRERGKIKVVMREVQDTLRRYEQKFPDFDELDPFYRDLVDLLADVDATRKALGAIRWARQQIGRVCKDALRRMGHAASADAVVAERKRAYGRIVSVLNQVDGELSVLAAAREAMRHLPTVRTDVPTIVVAGYPNVGKSSFLERISSARPVVASYPFTTQGIQVGHTERGRLMYQLVDTPGLLDRPLAKRNDIERQAVLALEHLADVIVFLLDPSASCGYLPEEQAGLLKEVRDLFPGVPLLIVDNKIDLPAGPSDAEHLRMSTLTGEGVEEVLEAAIALVPQEEPWV